MFARALVELDLAAKPIDGVYIKTPQSVRFQKFAIENPPKRCELCVNFLVQDYCHSCWQKYINKGKQLLGLEYGTQSQENVVGEGTTMATNNDTWITVQPRGRVEMVWQSQQHQLQFAATAAGHSKETGTDSF